MIAVGHQPNYLPYLGIFAKVAQSDVFVIVNNVQFVKRGPFGFQNRTRIRTESGWSWLTVPVQTSGRYHQQICETRTSDAIPWPRKHWRTIVQHYRTAPYFEEHSKFFEALYSRDWDLLQELNIAIIRYLLDALGIEVEVLVSKEADIDGHGTDLIVDICRKTGADTYIHGKHGGDYADFGKIEAAGVRNLVLDYEHPTYTQCYDGFEPYMAVIDLLFNHGQRSLEILLEGNCVT